MNDEHERLTEKLADLDPVGLIRIGAPRDEYSSEAKSILARRQEPNLAGVCREVFEASFDGCCGEHDWEEMARALEPLLNP